MQKFAPPECVLLEIGYWRTRMELIDDLPESSFVYRRILKNVSSVRLVQEICCACQIEQRTRLFRVKRIDVSFLGRK